MSCLNKGQVTTDEALTGNYDCIVGVISLLIEPVLPAPPVAASAYYIENIFSLFSKFHDWVLI